MPKIHSIPKFNSERFSERIKTHLHRIRDHGPKRTIFVPSSKCIYDNCKNNAYFTLRKKFPTEEDVRDHCHCGIRTWKYCLRHMVDSININRDHQHNIGHCHKCKGTYCFESIKYVLFKEGEKEEEIEEEVWKRKETSQGEIIWYR